MGFGRAFIDPALKFIAQHGGSIRFGHRLRALTFDGTRVSKLDFGEDTIDLAPDDAVIVAVPPPVAADLLPGSPCRPSSAPSSTRTTASSATSRLRP